MANLETHSCCTCGYTWKHGEHGGHTCSTLLLKKIETLGSLLDEAIDMLEDKSRSYLLAKWAENN